MMMMMMMMVVVMVVVVAVVPRVYKRATMRELSFRETKYTFFQR